MFAVQITVTVPSTFHITQLDHSHFCLPVYSKRYWTRCLNIRCVQLCAMTDASRQASVHGRQAAPWRTSLHSTNRLSAHHCHSNCRTLMAVAVLNLSVVTWELMLVRLHSRYPCRLVDIVLKQNNSFRACTQHHHVEYRQFFLHSGFLRVFLHRLPLYRLVYTVFICIFIPCVYTSDPSIDL
jgi:hypothetical protein